MSIETTSYHDMEELSELQESLKELKDYTIFLPLSGDLIFKYRYTLEKVIEYIEKENKRLNPIHEDNIVCPKCGETELALIIDKHNKKGISISIVRTKINPNLSPIDVNHYNCNTCGYHWSDPIHKKINI